MKQIRNKLLAALAAVVLALQCAAPALAAAEETGRLVSIRSAEDWSALIESCSLDTWSRDKTVVLRADISLHELEYSQVPSFGGVFEGGGHQISGLDLSSARASAGLFRVVQPGAEIRNLRVAGTVHPAGQAERVGGVAGENYGTLTNCTFIGAVTAESCVGGIAGFNGPEGRLRSCTSGGTVSGKSMTGGIAGRNEGVISACRNNAYVNISSVDPGLNPTELDLDMEKSLLTLQSLDTVNIISDTGGVAGYSSGMIISSENHGAVGYPHVGYNAGGIVGRTAGYVENCVNDAAVYGRRDIGGIAGQAEPYVELRLTADRAALLQSQLSALQQMVDSAAADAYNASADVSALLSSAGSNVRDAVDGGYDLAEQVRDYASDTITELNRGSDLIGDTVDRLSGISADLTPLSEDMTAGLEQLEQSIRQLADTGEFASDAAEQLEDAAADADTAGQSFTDGSRQVTDGLDALDEAVSTGDEEGAKKALDQIRQGMRQLSSASASAGAAMEDLSRVLAATPQSTQAVADLRSSTAALSRDTESLSASIEALRDSVGYEAETDEEWAEVNQALEDLGTGNTALLAAAGTAADAASRLINSESLAERVQAQQDLTDALGNAGQAMDTVSGSLTVLQKYIRVDAQAASAALTAAESALAAVSRDIGLAAGAAGRLVSDAAARVPEAEQALREFSQAFSELSDAFSTLEKGMGALEDAAPGLSGIQSALRTVLRGLEQLENASVPLQNAAGELEAALSSLGQVSDQLSAGLGTLGDAADTFRGASEKSTGIFEKTEDMLRTLSDADPIQFSQPTEELDASVDSIHAALNRLGDNLSALNSRSLSASGSLSGSLRDINSQFGTVADTLMDLLYDLEQADTEDRISDTSAEDVDSVTTGKLRLCVNHAAISGDINVGGVAGTMSIEYELDPENDLLAGSTPVYRREYAMKAILQHCSSDGAVTAKRDCAGSICGRVDLGLVTQCTGLGSVESESGDYVGGVAGFSAYFVELVPGPGRPPLCGGHRGRPGGGRLRQRRAHRKLRFLCPNRPAGAVRRSHSRQFRGGICQQPLCHRRNSGAGRHQHCRQR